MDFSISAKMEEILGKIRQFVTAEIHPLESQLQTKTFRELLPTLILQSVGRASSYSSVISRALNAGEKLAESIVCVAPIGIRLHRGKLEIK